jgi:hypothetical protein
MTQWVDALEGEARDRPEERFDGEEPNGGRDLDEVVHTLDVGGRLDADSHPDVPGPGQPARQGAHPIRALGEHLELVPRGQFHRLEDALDEGVRNVAVVGLLTHFAAFRTVTCYVADLPPRDVLASLGFHEDERGANLWLALPRDEGVFLGVEERDGLPCVHPVQVWLDLKGHPERASEAARHLEESLLVWRSRA